VKIFWTVFLLSFVFIFAAAESYALIHNTTTLSRYVWDLSAAWPPLPFFAGFAAGFLACHFWWGGIVSFKPSKTS
jgi:hypothetical protein